MPMFRKKPVVIEAVLVRTALDNSAHNWQRLPEWLRDAYEGGLIVFAPNCVHIGTKEGNMTGNIDDWIIRGVKGELYPCKPDIFEATYEPVAGKGAN